VNGAPAYNTVLAGKMTYDLRRLRLHGLKTPFGQTLV
jgi:hypothetical protein